VISDSAFSLCDSSSCNGSNISSEQHFSTQLIADCCDMLCSNVSSPWSADCGREMAQHHTAAAAAATVAAAVAVAAPQQQQQQQQ
jgi:hypothetical protein